MNEVLRILFIEDSVSDAELIWHEIVKNKIESEKLLVDNKQDFLEALSSYQPDIIISDYTLPKFNGMAALVLRNELSPYIPFLLVTGSINEEVAVECIKAGADDYILKENLSRLVPAIMSSLNKSKLTKEKKAAEIELYKSEQRLMKAQSIAHVGNWELDLSARIMWSSDEALTIYGLEKGRHEIPFDVVKAIPLPEYRKILDESLDSLLKYNEKYEVEFKIKRLNDGEIRTIFSKAELMVEPESSQVKVIGVIQDITERKRAEEALAFNNLLLRTQQESSADGILIVDENDKIVNFNQKFIEFARIPKEIVESGADILVRKYVAEQIVNPDEFLNRVNYLNKFREEISHDQLNFKDGRIYDRYSAPMFGPDKKYYGRVWYFHNITDRKLAEEAISQERRMLRTLIDNLPHTIYVEDAECKKVIANAADVKMTGRTAEAEVLGKTDLELYPGEQGRRGYAEDRKVILSGQPINDLEEEFIQPDGSKRWLLTTKIPLHDKSGNITGLVGIGHDITERKRVEAELQQSNDFSNSLLSTIPFGMHIVDEEGNILFQSDSFQRLTGGKSAGLKCWEFYRDDKTQCDGCPLRRGINIGETESYESHGVMGNRIFEINHTGMMYKGRKAMLEIFQDITERKENELELIRAKVKAEESDKLKTAFLHNISHEIRTPMNAIVGFSALLGEPDIDLQSRESYVDVIMQSSNHLLQIISDIVDISNIEANIIKTSKKEVNVNHTLKSLVAQYEPVAARKNIELSYQSALPDGDSVIITDNSKLNQILSNLLSNALKFTEKGSVKIWYSVRDSVIDFKVADTGIGIAAEHFDKIFGRFYQIQNTVSKLNEGTGLGLSISKAYAEHLGGKISLTSELSEGSTFSVTLPYEKAIKVPIHTAVPKAREGFAFTGKKVILVAEDVESNFKLIKYFLSGANTELIHASNGKEAVEKYFANQSIDLILMDIKMPVMDGYTAVKLIREKNTRIPIIAQTAYADDREKALECGCSGFIAKPFDKKSLFNVLKEFI